MFESKHSQSTAESENLHMGYTHSWNRPTIIEPATFNAIRKDLLALLPALEMAGSPLADAYGREEPEIGPEFIGFNRVACCGHASNPGIKIPWPARDAHGIGDNAGLGGTLPYRTCNGDCSYEPVWFERCQAAGTENGITESFCKTAFRPYDLAVTAFLVIARHHLGSRFEVQTDGELGHWADAFALCQDMLGYGAGYGFHNGFLVGGQEGARCA